MSVKRGVSEDRYDAAPQRLRDMVKAGLLEPQCPVVEPHTRREHVYTPTPSRAMGLTFAHGMPCAMDDA